MHERDTKNIQFHDSIWLIFHNYFVNKSVFPQLMTKIPGDQPQMRHSFKLILHDVNQEWFVTTSLSNKFDRQTIDATFKQCLASFWLCLATFQQCLMNFQQCLATFQLCLVTFQQCLATLQQCLVIIHKNRPISDSLIHLEWKNDFHRLEFGLL